MRSVVVSPMEHEGLPSLCRFGCCLALLVASLAAPTAAWALANPASVFCVRQGGTLRPQPDGRTYCRLPSGRVVEEWDYFRAQHKRAQPRT